MTLVRLAMATSFHYMMSLKGRPCRVVDIRMVAVEELSFEAIGRFVTATRSLGFRPITDSSAIGG